MRRPALFAWLGVFGPPLIWAVQHIGGWSIGLARCPDGAPGPGWNVPVHPLSLVLGAAAALAAAGCGVAAVIAWRATEAADDSDAPPAGRIHFLAVIGMTIAPLFVLLIVISSTGAVVLPDCVQS